MALLALQLVWLVAVPPFRGMDEFDHAYKAAGTARGQVLTTPSEATRGTGAWFTVPPDLVRAARFECESLKYTRWRDCRGAPVDGGTRVASGAGRYHPAFYAVVGLVAAPFHGTAALLVMRLTSMGLCLLLLGLGLATTSRWARTAWPAHLLLVGCTPTVLYSSVVAAPNGLEMASALTFWTAGLGLLLPATRRDRRFLAVAAGVSGALLVTLRPLGPVWCLLAVAVLLLAVRPDRTHLTALARTRCVVVAGAVVLLSTLQATWWVLSQRALVVSQGGGEPMSTTAALLDGLQQVPLWVLQAIGAFPYRNQATLPLVYVCYLLLATAALVLGVRAAARPVRVALLVGGLLCVLVPYAITVRTASTAVGAWQGRYSVPALIGIAVLLGHALDRRETRPPCPVLLLGGLAYAAAQALSPWDVVRRESTRTDLLATHAWLAPPSWVVLVAALGASALAWWAASRTGDDARAQGCQAARDAATQRSSSACASPESTA